MALSLISSAASASTWYVNGVSGSDSNDCKSPTTACKTIGHAISLASSGDSIKVAPATYTENLTISLSLNVIGAGAVKTIINGGASGTVVTISSGTHVTLSKLTIRNGSAEWGGGIFNSGALTISRSTLTANASTGKGFRGAEGGAIYNSGKLVINGSTISGNTANGSAGGIGGGIFSFGSAIIGNSTLSTNSTSGSGGGIYNAGNLTINNSTLSANSAGAGGGIYGPVGSTTLQNSIVANSPAGGNCGGTIISNGYNLSSDATCNFSNVGDLSNTDPMLGPLQNNGGPTQTMALSSGSPAIDAGNPNGCTDGQGHLLKTDQRGKPRPDAEDNGGCDMGAYERQSD
jgi:hypothetical protein